MQQLGKKSDTDKCGNAHLNPICGFWSQSSDKYPGKLPGQGRSSDYSTFSRPSHLLMQTVAKQVAKSLKELTASGNVQDLHLIPFSSSCQKQVEPLLPQKYTVMPRNDDIF
jgi:hypothetical protein